jgi:uncharacterized RDD family membrane protein YckC
MKPCALPRRLAAMLYDGLLIMALWMAATAVIVVLRQAEIQPGNPLFQLYLLSTAWLYLAISWRAGQSVGMRAWRIRLISDRHATTWGQTLVRFLVAILSAAPVGLGFWWSLFHPEKSSWHDLASHSRLVVIPKQSIKNA